MTAHFPPPPSAQAARTVITGLRRPRLLVRAARFGLAEYDRTRDLARLIGAGSAPTPARAFDTLAVREAQLDADRRAGAAGYSPARHVEVLIALLAEARLLASDADPEAGH